MNMLKMVVTVFILPRCSLQSVHITRHVLITGRHWLDGVRCPGCYVIHRSTGCPVLVHEF